MNVTELLKPWESINAALGLSGPIRDEAHYAELMAFVDECFDRFGGDDRHPVFTLVNLVADRIMEYEAANYPMPPAATPAEVLAFLMDQHGLKQADLPELGGQSVVSDILNGKRTINLRQAKALAARFSVGLEMFA